MRSTPPFAARPLRSAFAVVAVATFTGLAVGATACSSDASTTDKAGTGGSPGSGNGGTSSDESGGSPGAGGSGTNAGGTTNGAGGVVMVSNGGAAPACTTQCTGPNGVRTTCPGTFTEQDCGSACAQRGLVGNTCVNDDCVCSTPGTGAGGGGAAPTCVPSCASDTTRRVTCGNSTSTKDCGTICEARGLTGTECSGTDCVCTSGPPPCTFSCTGNSLKKVCGGSTTTQDCGSICTSRGLVGTTCAGDDCVCSTPGAGGATGAGGKTGAGGAPSGCTTTCSQGQDPNGELTLLTKTCVDSAGTHLTTIQCIKDGVCAPLTHARCKNNACDCF